MSARRTTLADVARLAGTSTAVVSYVVNDGPRPVSAQLRARVHAALVELDYRPDPIARALRRRRRWGQLGLLVPDVTLPLFGMLVGQIEAEARRRGQLVLTGNTGFDAAVEAEFVGAFIDAGVDGLIVVGGADAAATAERCDRERVPFIRVHNSADAPPSGTAVDIVGADHVAAGRLAAEHLVHHHGRRHVHFVGGHTAHDVRLGDRETVRDRLLGFAQVGGVVPRPLSTDLALPRAYAVVSAALAEPGRPDGLVVGTYGQTAAVLRAVTDAGLRVPDDVAVVGFDGDVRNRYEQIVLTTVQQPTEAIAERALDRVLDPRRTPPGPADRFDVDVHPGESCGCLLAR